ncbi:MAG: GIY-YIG nuclease family protein [Bacillaceae bacterium]|nr:GIY-YIG nuclease family protein [Bacillaceae bacterium]
MDINTEHQLYVLHLYVAQDQTLQIGKLGSFHFPPGFYAYIGSARKHIKARIERHLKREKKKRWHMDYLRPHADIVRVETFSGDVWTECSLCEHVKNENRASMPARGFGSSDCRCVSHLLYLSDRPPEDIEI